MVFSKPPVAGTNSARISHFNRIDTCHPLPLPVNQKVSVLIRIFVGNDDTAQRVHGRGKRDLSDAPNNSDADEIGAFGSCLPRFRMGQSVSSSCGRSFRTVVQSSYHDFLPCSPITNDFYIDIACDSQIRLNPVVQQL